MTPQELDNAPIGTVIATRNQPDEPICIAVVKVGNNSWEITGGRKKVDVQELLFINRPGEWEKLA